MASSGSGQVQELLDIVKRRAWQIVLPALLGVALANAVATLLPRKYQVSTQLELRDTALPATGEGAVARGIQNDVASAQYHIKSSERIRRVIEKLEWQDFTSLSKVMQYEYLRDVADRIQVTAKVAPKRVGSSFITIRYSDSDAQRAEQFTNRLRDAYTSEVVERFREEARGVRDSLQNQMAIAQYVYRDKEKEAAELKREHGLSATQQAPGDGGPRAEDPVYTRLVRAREELSNVQVQLVTKQAGLSALEELLAEAPREVPMESITSGMGYETRLAQIEMEIARQKDRQEGILPAHSVWQAAQQEILDLTEERDRLVEEATSPVRELQLVPNPRREQLAGEVEDVQVEIRQLEAKQSQLSATIEELANTHSKLSETYREIREITSEVAIARKNYDDLSQRFKASESFVELINQPHANPFIVSEEAIAPREHTSPNEALILVIGLVLGLGVGLGTAVLAEFGNAGFRGVSDITRAMAVPVLGVVNAIVTREEARKRAMRQITVAVSTLVLVAAIVWVTWAYENSPRLLGSELTRLIDDLKSKLR